MNINETYEIPERASKVSNIPKCLILKNPIFLFIRGQQIFKSPITVERTTGTVITAPTGTIYCFYSFRATSLFVAFSKILFSFFPKIELVIERREATERSLLSQCFFHHASSSSITDNNKKAYRP